ncbi:M48 family metalloprotease [Bacteroidota bacterium]
MRKPAFYILFFILTSSFVFNSCKKDEDDPGGFNLFSLNDDISFGKEFDNEIKNNPAEYPILDSVQYAAAYKHIYGIRDSILNTGLVGYDDVFPWRVRIINNDSVLNAFAVPGGYTYFYTGIIKYLDNEAQFAGVMAHEMAHVARRHSTNQLTKVYGIQIILSIALGGNSDMLTQIAAELASGLAALAFSRNHEYEADEYAVKYTYPTSYDALGIAGFFQKMEGASHPPEFLSTHPSPDNRIEEIEKEWQALGSKVGNTYVTSYNNFKAMLP